MDKSINTLLAWYKFVLLIFGCPALVALLIFIGHQIYPIENFLIVGQTLKAFFAGSLAVCLGLSIIAASLRLFLLFLQKIKIASHREE